MAAEAGDPKAFWLKQIAECIEGLKFGQVHITVHDGRIVQIDRIERKRFDPNDATDRSRKEKKSKRQTGE